MKGNNVFIVVVCVFAIIGMSSCTWDFSGLGKMEDVSKSGSISASSITSIRIEVDVADITITPMDRDDIFAELSGRSTAEDLELSVSGKDGIATIRCKTENASRNELSLKISIPQTLEADDLSVFTDVGTIGIEDITVKGTMSLTSEVGSINASYAGAAVCNITTDVGDIAVTLPGSSSFHLTAVTDVCKVNYSGFTFNSVESDKSRNVAGTVNGSSDTMSDIQLKTDVGDITIKGR
jgi:hypothetical protein